LNGQNSFVSGSDKMVEEKGCCGGWTADDKGEA